MATLTRGATGERVRDLHERLGQLGHVLLRNDRSTFSEETVALVEAFQRTKGLAITGDVDDVTWTRLVEAGWRLGERLLYLAHPHLRGDDVAELQVRLAQLGFNPGRIDGIFGPLLDHALSDFQGNTGLEVNGTLTRRTLIELTRLTPSGSRQLVNEARDSAGFQEELTGPLVLCGTSSLRGQLHGAISSQREVVVLETTLAGEIAAYANDSEASVVLCVDEMPETEGLQIHYWASYKSHSRRGEMLASAFASALARSSLTTRVEVTGMALPLLRETRMTTLLIEHGSLDREQLDIICGALTTVLVEVFHR